MTGKTFNKVSFYIVAHADDWQLFMQPNAYNDIVAFNTKVVFIITTAGDAGFEKTYWAAREQGLKSSIRFCMAPVTKIVESTGMKNFDGHIVEYWSANNVTCYFLRLPDGNLDGTGFPLYNHQSLLSFREERIKTIAAVDYSTTYRSWSDVIMVLQTIITSEVEELSKVVINYLNPNSSLNPDDHIDHIMTGKAVQNIESISSFHQSLFVGYSVDDKEKTMQLIDLFWKAGMFAAYEKAVYDNSGYSTLKETIQTYMRWCLSSANFITIDPIFEVVSLQRWWYSCFISN